MRNKILLCSIILCCHSIIAYGQETTEQANSYFEKGIFYKGLFNATINRQINVYNARLYLIDNKEKIAKLADKKIKFSKDEISCIRYYRGLCYYYQGRLEKAILDFEKVSKSSDKYLEARIRLVGCYYEQGKIKEATRLWNEVYPKKENNPLTKKDIDNALNALNKTPKSKTVFYDPSILNLKSQKYLGLAVKYYQKESQNEDSQCLCGIAELMDGRINDSIRTLTPLIYSNRWEIKAKAKINLGVAYYLKGERAKSNTLWDEVKREYNNKPGVISELGYTYSRLGINLNEALSLCREARGLFSYHLGMVYFKKGVIENKTDYTYNATRLLENGCGSDSLFLLDLSNAYYYKKWFDHSINILMQIPDMEIKDVIYLTQNMSENWKIFTWCPGLGLPEFKLEWIDIWY